MTRVITNFLYMPSNKIIYLDHAATTPMDPEVLKAMEPYFTETFGNAASIHRAGQNALKAVDEARQTVADFLGCKPKEAIFTSGATESDNMAIRGVLAELVNRGVKKEDLHVITSSIEHPAVLETCQFVEKEGYDVSYLPVGKGGIVGLDELKKVIKDTTVLVSIMYVNNEIGTIQPIQEIGGYLRKLNEERVKDKLPKIIFHTDAVQAAPYLDCNVDKLGVDLLSLSGHKIYGPKGIGIFYVRERTPITAIQIGGHQENKLRSGTLNVPGIVGIAKALALIAEERRTNKLEQMKRMRDDFVQTMRKSLDKVIINGDMEKRVPANIHMSFYGAEGESILMMLDDQGISISTGSACASGSLEPSHVLTAMGLNPEYSHGCVRITIGRYTKEDDLDKLAKVLPPIIKKLREMSPLKQIN